MSHLGDYDTSTVIYGHFTTYQPSTGATFLLGGSPVLSVYKDNSTTQSTTGVSLTANFDSVTGFNLFTVDTSADGTFYSAGSFFSVVITTGTVDSISVTGSVVASFTLRKDSALKPLVAGRTLDVDASSLANISQTAADKVFGSSGAAMAELGAVPSATPSPRNALMLLFMTLRNKLTTTASAKTVFNDAGAAIASKSLSDDGTTYTEAEMS